MNYGLNVFTSYHLNVSQVIVVMFSQVKVKLFSRAQKFPPLKHKLTNHNLEVPTSEARVN